MNDVSQSGEAASDFDLTQFYQIFFEEAAENLDAMEQMLLALNPDAADDEELNGIFRCAHSIKGGASTFGFSDVAELTHQMESLLDRLRRRELHPTAQMIDVLLQSADASRALLNRHQAGGVGVPVETAVLVEQIVRLAAPDRAAAVVAEAEPPPVASPEPLQDAADLAAVRPGHPARCIELMVGPLGDASVATAVEELFRDIPNLGVIDERVSSGDGTFVYRVRTDTSDEELTDLLAFHVAREQVRIREITSVAADRLEASSPADEPTGKIVSRTAVSASVPPGLSPAEGYGFFDGAPGAPGRPPASPAVAEKDAGQQVATKPTGKAQTTGASAAGAAEAATIRVSVNKVDQLINLVGELVITQAMLAQQGRGLDSATHQKLLAGLADLDRNTRELQESVMSIRMIPMSVVFNRFPRMLRDLAGKLGKKVDFVTFGESTELDKGLVEKITDPLTHLVRNSCDHGIELPAERLAAGKPEQGTIALSAAHQGGSIVIDVRDDGRGMSRSRILAKARERGLDVSDHMADADVWQLIFAPGFSTAEVVTDVSGRGVGMDVVKRNIMSLNGTVEIESVEGQGTVVSVRLPLTLAIMDGMSVGVGQEVYMLPLSSVVESFKVKAGSINTVGHDARLVRVRDEFMPVVELEKVFSVPRPASQEPSDIMVVIEAEGRRVALLVDELLGQQQVVVKNLETNYRKVLNVSGATILGDGKVALILDTVALVRRSRH